MDWLDRREARERDDARSPGAVDYARVIHSASFRRLQGKTQILNLGDSDFYRTRLTHSLEVAQIAGGLVAQLQAGFPGHPATALLSEPAMIQAISCAHDLGHPPFGHGGEVALNYAMRDHGGFEGNGQTLRLLARLEAFSDHAGANLTRRSLLGVLKYPIPYSAAMNRGLRPALAQGLSLDCVDVAASTPPKCYLDGETEVVDWVLAPLSAEDREGFTAVQARPGQHGRSRWKSLDCSIMDLADDIAYGVHDLEDAIALDLVGAADLARAIPPDAVAGFLAHIRDHSGAPPDHNALIAALTGDERRRKWVIGRLVNHFITAARFAPEADFAEPLLRHRIDLPEGPTALLAALKGFVLAQVIHSAPVQQLEFKGQTMVLAVFEAFLSRPEKLLPDRWRRRFQAEGPRAICDAVASMTDTSLLGSYERLFAPRMGSVFDRL